MSCPDPLDLARSVDGEATHNEVAAIERHLPACARCRQQMDELRAIIAALAADPVDSLDVNLALLDVDLAPLVVRRALLPPRRRAWLDFARRRMAFVTVAGAVAATGVFVTTSALRAREPVVVGAPVASTTGASDSAFRVKGGRETADSWIALRPYRVNRSGTAPLPRTGGHFSTSDGLLLAYDNGGPHPYAWMSVIAIARGTETAAHWLYPEAPRAGETGIRIEPGVERELRDELRLPVRAGEGVTLYAVFSHAPLPLERLRSVEKSALAGRLAARATDGVGPDSIGLDSIGLDVIGDAP